ncbi:MAG: ATP-grasp domain-containing protein [bacterium]|nr:ATP-grasp domain-containing protein [bacterium]
MPVSVYARVWDHDTRGVLHGLPALLETFALRVLIVAHGSQKGEQRELVLLPPGVDATEEVELLNRLGFGPRPDDVKVADAALLDGTIRGLPLYPFSGTSLKALQLATATGAHFRGPAFDLAWKWNDKGAFARLADKYGWSGTKIPAGRVVRLEDLSPSHIAECRRMFGQRKLIIKGTRSASGLEQFILREHEEWDAIESHMGEFCRSPELVIQPWIEHGVDASVQFSVNRDGNRRLPSDTTQLIVGEVHHTGNIFPAAMQNTSYLMMRAFADRVVCALVDEGLRDTVGSVDFIIDHAGNPWACEVNARIVAPWYPWKAMVRRFGHDVPPFAMRSVQMPTGVTASQIATTLGRELLFDPKKRIGVIPFCIVPAEGFAYTVTFGRNVAERSELFDAAMRRLGQLSA